MIRRRTHIQQIYDLLDAMFSPNLPPWTEAESCEGQPEEGSRSALVADSELLNDYAVAGMAFIESDLFLEDDGEYGCMRCLKRGARRLDPEWHMIGCASGLMIRCIATTPMVMKRS